MFIFGRFATGCEYFEPNLERQSNKTGDQRVRPCLAAPVQPRNEVIKSRCHVDNEGARVGAGHCGSDRGL